METRDEFLATLAMRSELLERIQVFAHHPQTWIDDSRWDGFTNQQGMISEPTLLDRFREPENHQRFRKRFAQTLESHFGLEKVDYRDFSESRWRFALLAPDLFKRLAFSVGLMRTSPTLTAAIHRDQVARIVDQIGEDVYREVIERAPLTIGTGYQGVPLSAEDLSVNLRTAVTRVGWSSLGNALSGAPESILERLRLKFPYTVEIDLELGLQANEPEPGLAALMVRILKNHVNRRAATCVF